MIKSIEIAIPSAAEFNCIFKAAEKTGAVAEEMTKIHSLLSFVSKHPDRDILAAIRYIMDQEPKVRYSHDRNTRETKVSFLKIIEQFPEPFIERKEISRSRWTE